jgi:hypothetical protein
MCPLNTNSTSFNARIWSSSHEFADCVIIKFIETHPHFNLIRGGKGVLSGQIMEAFSNMLENIHQKYSRHLKNYATVPLL